MVFSTPARTFFTLDLPARTSALICLSSSTRAEAGTLGAEEGGRRAECAGADSSGKGALVVEKKKRQLRGGLRGQRGAERGAEGLGAVVSSVGRRQNTSSPGGRSHGALTAAHVPRGRRR